MRETLDLVNTESEGKKAYVRAYKNKMVQNSGSCSILDSFHCASGWTDVSQPDLLHALLYAVKFGHNRNNGKDEMVMLTFLFIF